MLPPVLFLQSPWQLPLVRLPVRRLGVFVSLRRMCQFQVLLLNCQPHQTSGPSTSCSWRSSTMSACCPTSPPCRRTGVLQNLLQHCCEKGSVCVYAHLDCVPREPVEGEELREQFCCRVRRLQSETHGGAETHLQDSPQVATGLKLKLAKGPCSA